MKTYRNKNDIRVGVVGYGGSYNMGQKHLSQMQEAGMTPTAVAEIDPSRLETAEANFPGIGQFSSLRDMLENSEVDLITIITPHNTHAPLALEALAEGKHVICEKPMAITTEEVDAMIDFVGTEGSLTFPNPKNPYSLVQWKDGDRTVTEAEQLPNEHGRFYENISGYLVGMEDLVITPEWARRPIHILDLATQSALAGKTLTPIYG